ncbi:MAG: alpha/beta fold hydrolase [Dehalococcoidia bacterium]|nr:alpha/beta fold hydrolase [Dehalococcoidia bacterium]
MDGAARAPRRIAGLPALVNGPARARGTLILAHGAGAPMDHPFMTTVAEAVAAQGIRVVRFEFPYMAARREGRRPGPDREPVLRESWTRVVAEAGTRGRTVIGGKSMGGRIASMVADDPSVTERVTGVVCLGYPFHPPGRPDRLRTAHLEEIATPVLILQGERDIFGARAEVEGYRLSEQVEVRWFEDGDHSLKPRKSSGRTEAEHLAEAARLASEFVLRVTG